MNAVIYCFRILSKVFLVVCLIALALTVVIVLANVIGGTYHDFAANHPAIGLEGVRSLAIQVSFWLTLLATMPKSRAGFHERSLVPSGVGMFVAMTLLFTFKAVSSADDLVDLRILVVMIFAYAAISTSGHLLSRRRILNFDD